MQKELTIQGESFVYVKERRMGGAVYKNDDGSRYVRVANINDIHGEVNFTKELHERHFPVPRVLDEGKISDTLHYYIEESLGNTVFGEQFQKETKEHGAVLDSTFDRFTEVVLTYARAQFDGKNFVLRNRADIARTILLDNVWRNNPPSEEIEEQFNVAYKKAADRVMELPFGYLQSDLNAYNILEGGVIDFENASLGPVGFDIITNVFFGRFWPRIALAYNVTDEQIDRYNAAVDEIATSMGLPKMTDYRNDFILLKAIRATHKGVTSEEHPDCNPQFWDWRVRVRDWCIYQYLENKTLHTRDFEKVGGEVIKHPEHFGHEGT